MAKRTDRGIEGGIEELRWGRRAADFTLPGAASHYPPDLELEPVHLAIDLLVEIEAKRASGTVTHTVRARAGGTPTYKIHAVDFEDVEVTAPDGEAVSYRYDGREIHVDWKDAWKAREERTLAIRYQVEEPVTGLFFSAPDDEYPERALWAATDHETERARHWLPTIDLPNARPTLTFHLRAKAELTILANGSLVEETAHDDGTKTAHWKLEQPCPSYLTCFTIGDFVRFDDGAVDDIECSYFTSKYFTPEDLERSFGRTRDMLAWMQKKLDHPFPYPKYFQFALPGFGGAMENISLVSWDDQFVLDETLEKEWGWLVDMINVHEMAHSYFGDMVVCRDYAHAWLKESWATYVELLWVEDTLGRDEADYYFYTHVDSYASEADESYKRPIVTRKFNHSWQMYDRHLYPGGGARLHMLRKELGDGIFWRGVHAYLKRYAHKVVETADFRRCLEEASGRSLGKFFEQWIYSKGYPKLKATFAWDEKKKTGTFTIEQKQVDEKAEIPAFDLPLDIGWVVDGTLATKTVTISKAKEVVVVPMEKKPEQVRIDPKNRAVLKLDFNPGGEMLRTQLRTAPDVVGRILAGNELCGTGRRKNIEAVRDAYREESFWGVRVRFAQALAKAATEASVEALAELIAWEQDPMVMESLIRAAGRLRDARIRSAIEARLDDGLGLYRATQAAYEALGAQRDDAPFDRLVEASGIEDRYGVEQSGALRGLAGARREEGVEVLEARIPYGATQERARPTAAMALGVLGRSQAKPRREAIAARLVDLLRDPSDRVRTGAVGGLAALGEPSAIGALTAYRAGISDQEKVSADRAMAAIRGAQKPKVPALEKQVDELREKLRKLEDAVGKLEATKDT